MLQRRITLLVLAVVLPLALSLPAGAGAAEVFGPTLQLGPIPRAESGQGWSLAVPLGLDASQCALETKDNQLSLITISGGEACLVVEAHGTGPISGLLRMTQADGSVRHTAVAAEGVEIAPDRMPTLLLVSARAGGPLRRMLRLPSPVSAVGFAGVVTPVAAPDAAGWQLIEVPTPVGFTEKQGRLYLVGGAEVELQVSLMESITTLAATPLPGGWSYGQLMTMNESLTRAKLRARVAVVGRRADARTLRLFDVTHDAGSGSGRFFLRSTVDLPALDPTRSHRLLRLRARAGSTEQRIRQPFMLRLSGENALLIDPVTGPVGEGFLSGLHFAGAATPSGMKRDHLFAIRRDVSTGARYLRRWWVRMDNGQASLRGRLFEPPLQERMGVTNLRTFDLRAWRHSGLTGELRARESLLLLASTAQGKAEEPVTLFELRLRQDGSGRIDTVRRRYTSTLLYPRGTGLPSMQWVETPTVGADGYPRRLQFGVPGIRAGEIVELAGVGQRFTGRAYVRGVTHQVNIGSYPLDPMVFVHSEFDGRSTSLRRSSLGPDGLVTRARGRILESRIFERRMSARGRHSYALTDDGSGGVDAPFTLRLLTNGLPAGTNLPPQVDAGPDFRARSTNGSSATVQLRARLADANGDPLAVRWSAPGVRFTNPAGRLTRAEFPVGRTQVRVRAREGGGKAVLYEGSDILEVTVLAPSGTADTPTLVTALRGVYPNPANPRVSVAFTVERRDRIRILIHDMSGRLVRELLDEERGAGAYDVPWDGTDDQGRAVASGVYPVRLVSSRGVDVDRVVIVR